MGREIEENEMGLWYGRRKMKAGHMKEKASKEKGEEGRGMEMEGGRTGKAGVKGEEEYSVHLLK